MNLAFGEKSFIDLFLESRSISPVPLKIKEFNIMEKVEIEEI